MSEPVGPGAAESEDLAAAVYQGVLEWSDQTEQRSLSHVKYSLRGYLRRYLRRSQFTGVAGTVDVSRGSNDCDITVAGRVGIKILYGLHDGSREWVHKHLRSILNEYEHVILYGHQIQAEYTDLWRQIQRSLDRYTDDGNRIRVVGTIDGARYDVPLTSISIPRTLVRNFGIYGLFFVFILVGSRLVEASNHGTEMAGGFVGMVIVFNLVIVLMGVFLVRYL